MMPPRTAYSPVSRTVPVRRKPLISSQRDRAGSVSTTLPGAAEKVSAAMRARGGTRCTSALTVVERMRGLSSDVLRAGEPRQRRHALRGDRRCSATRGRRAGNPRPGRSGPRSRARRRRALLVSSAAAARRGRRGPGRPGPPTWPDRPRARSATTSASKPSGTLGQRQALGPSSGHRGRGSGRLVMSIVIGAISVEEVAVLAVRARALTVHAVDAAPWMR